MRKEKGLRKQRVQCPLISNPVSGILRRKKKNVKADSKERQQEEKKEKRCLQLIKV